MASASVYMGVGADGKEFRLWCLFFQPPKALDHQMTSLNPKPHKTETPWPRPRYKDRYFLPLRCSSNFKAMSPIPMGMQRASWGSYGGFYGVVGFQTFHACICAFRSWGSVLWIWSLVWSLKLTVFLFFFLGGGLELRTGWGFRS